MRHIRSLEPLERGKQSSTALCCWQRIRSLEQHKQAEQTWAALCILNHTNEQNKRQQLIVVAHS